MTHPYLVRDTDRHGNARIYVRPPRRQKTRIRAEPGTPEFDDAYADAMNAPISMSAISPRRIQFQPVVLRMLRKARSRATESNLPFAITSEWALDKIERQRFRCALTGIRFKIDAPENRAWLKNPYAPSFDRIDCSRGYEADNVRIVLLAVNYALNEWGEPVFAALASAYVRRKIRR